MVFSYNTLTILAFGSVLLVVYVVILLYQKRANEITFVELSKVFFASTTIISGMNLIYSTVLLLNDQVIEIDKMYTVYAGFCVMWVSFDELREKIKSGKHL